MSNRSKLQALVDSLFSGRAPTLKDVPANWDGRSTAKPASTFLEDQGNYLANFGKQAMETLDPGIGLAADIGASAGRGDYAQAALGVPLLAMSVAPGPSPKPKGITAYHGSPHDFDKFDLSKIGTGEGAQAYGHGLYFAENEGVARSYRDALSGLNIDGAQLSTPMADDMFSGVAMQNGVDRGAADFISTNLTDTLKGGFSVDDTVAALLAQKPNDPAFANALNAAATEAKKASKSPGRMYQVRINADPEQFLDWDKPLAQQSEAVRNALQPMISQSRKSYPGLDEELLTGQGAVKAYTGHRGGNPDVVSGAMREAGIPGIRYLDQGSRTAGQGSRNYVVFDDSIVEIIRKYGIAAATALFGAEAVNSAMNGKAQASEPIDDDVLSEMAKRAMRGDK